MSRSRKPRKPARKPQPPSATLLTPHGVSPVAPGVGPDGQPRPFHAPPWLSTYGFWGAWQACSMFAATALRELQDADDPFPWVAAPKPGIEEDRQLLGMQMRVALQAVPALAEAQVICLAPGELDGLQKLSQERFAALAREERLVHDPIYLDFTSDRDHIAALALGEDEKPWGLGGVLITRLSGHLEMTLFGSPPAPDDGPLAQPLGRAAFVTRAQMPDTPFPGEVLVDTSSWRTYMATISPESRIHARLRAVGYFAGPALELLAHVQDSTLVSAVRNPKARATLSAAGQRIALMPARRARLIAPSARAQEQSNSRN